MKTLKEFIKKEQLNEDVVGLILLALAAKVVAPVAAATIEHFGNKMISSIKKKLNSKDGSLLDKIKKLMAKDPELNKTIRAKTSSSDFKGGSTKTAKDALVKAMKKSGMKISEINSDIDNLLKKISNQANKMVK